MVLKFDYQPKTFFRHILYGSRKDVFETSYKMSYVLILDLVQYNCLGYVAVRRYFNERLSDLSLYYNQLLIFI